MSAAVFDAGQRFAAAHRSATRAMPTETDPEKWGTGLRFAGKALSTKSISRAVDPMDVLPVCLAHNLRSGNGDHRHRSRIDPSRTPLNEVLRGPDCPKVAAELAASILDELNIRPGRRDAIMAVELVMQPPDGADRPEFWAECLRTADSRYEHIVSAVVHRDQKRPHMHLLALAVADGRLAGNTLTAGQNRFTFQRQAFMAHMRNALGLRPDRAVKTLADLVVSAGRGPKTHVQAARRDADLERSAGADWQRHREMGMGVDGHGGSAPNAPNPHAQPESPTPLLRSVSSRETVFAMWRQVVAVSAPPRQPTRPCPAPALAAGNGRANQPASHLKGTSSGNGSEPDSTLTACCEDDPSPCRGLLAGTTKKHTTGIGNPDKAPMVAAIRAVGFNPADDTEAEALALLGWACVHGPPVGHDFGPQRDERPATAPTHHQRRGFAH